MFISPITPQYKYNNTVTSFHGWQPKSSKNKELVGQMSEIIKSPDVKNIAVSGHLMPDGDSISSCIACATLLKHATNKDIDVYIFGKVPERFKFITDKNDGINIIELEPNSDINKKYDLCVSVDTSSNNLIDKNYYQNVFQNAKHTLKIDHHPNNLNHQSDTNATSNYADMNYTDTNCTSASEVLMQFVKPLGLNPSKLPERFTDAVYSGMLSDSAGYKFVDNALVFNDAALLLSKGTNHSKISKSLFVKKELPQSIFDLDKQLKSKTKFSEDKKIGYIVIDDETEKYIKKAEADTDTMTVNGRLKRAVSQLNEKPGVEIAFNTRIVKNDDGTEEIASSIRSNELPINQVAAKFGGGGHEKAAGLHAPSQGKSAEEWADDLLNEYQKLVKLYFSM